MTAALELAFQPHYLGSPEVRSAAVGASVVGQAEVVMKEHREGLERLPRVRPLGLDANFGASRDGEHHELEDAAGVGFAAVVHQLHLRDEPANRFCNCRAGTDMQTREMIHPQPARQACRLVIRWVQRLNHRDHILIEIRLRAGQRIVRN